MIHTYIFVYIHTHTLSLTHSLSLSLSLSHTHTHREHDSLDENRGGGGGGGGFNARDGRAGEEGGEGVRVAVLGTSRRARGRTPLEGDVRYAYVSKET